jgi:hypothetical protein
VIISLSPTEAEMREDAALMAHLAGRPATPVAERSGPGSREKAAAIMMTGGGSGPVVKLQAWLT